MKRKYTKRNKRYWNGDHYLNKIGYLILFLALMAWLWVSISKLSNKGNLISPVYISEVKTSESISCEDVIGYIRCKFYKGELTEKEAITLIAIGKAESGLRENAKNRRSTASGVFQIVAPTWYQYRCTGDVLNFKDNTDCAVKIMKKDGSFRAWDAYNKGLHLKFIKDIII